MGDYCVNCHSYFNKLNSKKCCNSCFLEINGSPPSVNNFIYQYESKLKKENISEIIQLNFIAHNFLNLTNYYIIQQKIV